MNEVGGTGQTSLASDLIGLKLTTLGEDGSSALR